MKTLTRPLFPLLVVSLLIVAAPSGLAQSNDELFKPVDLTTPESPAFVALGVSPQEVHRPSTRDAFGASLLNAVDNKGKLQNGFAFEANPYLLFRGYILKNSDFNTSPMTRTLSRTTLSLASTKAAESDPTQRFAIGAYVKLIDVGDPRQDELLKDCIERHLSLPPPANPLQPAGTIVTQIIPETDPAITKCFDDSSARRANRSSWVIAFSPVWVSATGEANDLATDGGAIWTSLAYGFDRFKMIKTEDDTATTNVREDVPQSWFARNAQVIFHARWRDNEHVKEKDGTTTEHDSRFIGVRFRASGKRTAGSIELSHLVDDTAAKNVTKRRMLLGFEQQVGEGLWLNLAFGRDFGGRDGDQPIIARSSFRWVFNNKRQ